MWYKGKVEVIWDLSFKDFNYIEQPLTKEEIDKWKSQGYTHSSFSGVLYNSKNPMPDWVYKIADQLGLKDPGFVFYKMKTDDIMPVHVDHFRKYCEIFNIERSRVWRALVLLEDWKSGHYLEVDGNAICNYTAGSFAVWSADTPHAASNIGIEDRYTLQITGHFD